MDRLTIFIDRTSSYIFGPQEFESVHQLKETSVSSSYYLSTNHSENPFMSSFVARSLVYPPSLSKSGNAEYCDFYPDASISVKKPSISTFTDEKSKVSKEHALNYIETNGICLIPTEIEKDVPLSESCTDFGCGRNDSNVNIQIERTIKPAQEFRKCEQVKFDVSQLKKSIKLPINDVALHDICFDEKLTIAYHHGTASIPMIPEIVEGESRLEGVGQMTISITTNGKLIFIHSASDFRFEEKEASSRILSITNKSLVLIEERKVEVLSEPNNRQEKRLHIIRDKKDYIYFKSSSEDNTTVKNKKFLKNVNGDLIPDGVTLLLMRYLVTLKFVGELETWTTLISGEVCRARFSVAKHKTLIIKSRRVQVVRILKVIYRNGRVVSLSKTYFLPTGHIFRHRWKDCKYLVHAQDYPWNIRSCGYMERLENHWRNDIELQSKLLDLKEARQSEIKTYLNDNELIVHILTDYLVELVENKPKNILDFTVDYFQSIYYGNVT